MSSLYTNIFTSNIEKHCKCYTVFQNFFCECEMCFLNFYYLKTKMLYSAGVINVLVFGLKVIERATGNISEIHTFKNLTIFTYYYLHLV